MTETIPQHVLNQLREKDIPISQHSLLTNIDDPELTKDEEDELEDDTDTIIRDATTLKQVSRILARM